MPRLAATHRNAIREIFLRRRLEYTTQEAANLLRLGLYDALLSLEVAADPDVMEKLMPGFIEAIEFPNV